eukprot:3277261-Prymnesium_polylepis.2
MDRGVRPALGGVLGEDQRASFADARGGDAGGASKVQQDVVPSLVHPACVSYVETSALINARQQREADSLSPGWFVAVVGCACLLDGVEVALPLEAASRTANAASASAMSGASNVYWDAMFNGSICDVGAYAHSCGRAPSVTSTSDALKSERQISCSSSPVEVVDVSGADARENGSELSPSTSRRSSGTAAACSLEASPMKNTASTAAGRCAAKWAASTITSL